MYMNAYHKVQGEVRMFEVDARNAIARFPEEWSAEPWPNQPQGDEFERTDQLEDAAEMASAGEVATSATKVEAWGSKNGKG